MISSKVGEGVESSIGEGVGEGVVSVTGVGVGEALGVPVRNAPVIDRIR